MVTKIRDDRNRGLGHGTDDYHERDRVLFPYPYDYDKEVQQKKEEMLDDMETKAVWLAGFTHFLEIVGSQLHEIGRLGIDVFCDRLRADMETPVLKERDKQKLTEIAYGPECTCGECVFAGNKPYGFSRYFLNMLHQELGLSEKFQQRVNEELEGLRNGEIERRSPCPPILVASMGFSSLKKRLGVRGTPSDSKWKLVSENAMKAFKEYLLE